MRVVPETLRQHLLDGRAVSGLSLLCEGNALSLTGTGSRLSVEITGTTRVSDGYYDAGGGEALWGESALVGDDPLCVFNLAAAGQSSAWYLHDPDGLHALPADEMVAGLPYGSPGLDGTSLRVFYVDANGWLHVRDLSYTRGGSMAWAGASSTVANLETYEGVGWDNDLLVTNTLAGAACRALSATAVQIAGYNGRRLWLQRFTYTDGSWTGGPRQTVAYIAGGRLLPHSLGTVGDVVTLDIGGGSAVSYLYQDGVYSAPYPLLSLPPDQLVTPWGLSYANGRYICLVTTRIYGENGRYFAAHAAYCLFS